MKAKRFFLFIVLILMSLINNDEKEVINALNQIETSFTHVSARTASLLLSNQNIVYGWGLWGDINEPSYNIKFNAPTDISKDIALNENEEIINIFTGEQHSFLLTNNYRVFAFGSGQEGQFGYSNYVFNNSFVDITSLFALSSNEHILKIACGDDFNIALTSKNRVLSFGKNQDGQLGIKSDIIQAPLYDITKNFSLSENDYIVDVKCGASHSLALSNKGYIYVWGSNSYGQLGISNQTIITTPCRLESIQNSVIKFDVGRYSSYVLTSQAQLYGFGSDSCGQLATCETIISSNAKKEPFLMNHSFNLKSDEYIIDIIAGYYFAIVKTNLNNYYSFGENDCGQLGNASTISTSFPQKIEFDSLLQVQDEIDNISCGLSHCIATSKYGRIYAWGSNLYGQLSEDFSSYSSNKKILDITYNFPPIIIVSTNTSSIDYHYYQLDIDTFYLDNESIDETYYCITNSTKIPTNNWIQFNKKINIEDYEGKIYVHLKIVSIKGTYYHTCKALFFDNIAPTLSIYNKENEEILQSYYNSTIFLKALDNNNNVEIIYFLNGNKISTSSDSLTLSSDGNYKVFAIDEANNSSATIEFTIDTILPTITKIDYNPLIGSSYNSKNKEITIIGSEALACYKLDYKGKESNDYIALNDNESSFKVKLKKGDNYLTLIDLAGNNSITYKINYSPRFFQDTQLLLLTFASLTLIFVTIIIIVYSIKAKKKLLK